MTTLNVTDFREQCLQLIEELPIDGVLITKRGRPVAKLLPIASSGAELIGSISDLAVDPEDDLLSAGLKWDAQS